MRMVWQNMSPFPTPRMDAEEEREMRLAAQARTGAEWALAALIARYQPPVLRYLTRLTGNANQSHRAAERIFVRMERRLHGPHGGDHLRLWLLRAATEDGLEVLRHPNRQPSRLGAPEGPRGLLMDGISGGATDRLRAGLGKIAAITGSTRRQVRQLIWNTDGQASTDDAPHAQIAAPAEAAQDTAIPPSVDPELDTMNPREELRHRLIRAVLAELPYGDAQCLALHLVAGLNQTEVAQALGIRPSAARHRIVQGLQMFAQRYDATITSLGVPAEVAYTEEAQSLPASVANMMDALDVTSEPAQDYPAPAASPQRLENPAYPISETAAGGNGFTQAYGDSEYDLADVIAAPAVSAPVVDSPANAPAPSPVIVDALPVIPTDDVITHPASDTAVNGAQSVQDMRDSQDMQNSHTAIPDETTDDYWLDQPTMVPILSSGWAAATPEATADDAVAANGMSGTLVAMEASDAEGTAEAAKTAAEAAEAPSVPVLTPPNVP